MNRATVRSRVEFTGPSFFWPAKEVKISVEPAQERGLLFEVRGKVFPYTTMNSSGHQAVNGARYLKVQYNKRVVRVPEHLLSALFILGITDARIVCNSGEVPVCGPGIREFYNELSSMRTTIEGDAKVLNVKRKSEHVQRREGIESSVSVKPAHRLEIDILSGKHPDLVDIEEEKFTLDDFDRDFFRHLTARPVARLQNPFLYPLWRAFILIGYKGITPQNYIIAAPGENSADIRAKMQVQHRLGGNEYLAHTAVCDFPAELLSLASRVNGRFRLQNTNHLVRMNALRRFKEEGVFSE